MNPIEIGLSFLEGLALIASPCILPVLPLVLSSSVEGGRKRPFGIILGFVFAFTAFALLSRKLVLAFHINLDWINYGSLVLLALFGCVLLSEKLSAKFSAFTQRFAGAGSALTASAKDGFFSGIIIGLLIGLVWTPCAGPILAAVLVQVIRQQNDVHALFLIAAFAFGAGTPMLLIALTGRKIMSKLRFFTTHAEGVRKSFGVIILLTVVLLASGMNIQSAFSKSDTSIENKAKGLINGLETTYDAPEFAGIEAWLNSQPLTMKDLKGKVVLIDFWTYSCINCVRTLPYITAWDHKYRDQGLVIIGVHSPEFEFEKNQQNVKTAIASHKIAYPIALDNHLDTWTQFHNLYWPAHYLINKDGKVVYTHFGEGQYSTTENNIRYLLGLNKTEATEPQTHVSSENETNETYLGSDRATLFNSPQKLAPEEEQTFNLPSSIPVHHWALGGKWYIEGERITSKEAHAKLQLHFNAKKVFLVLGTRNGQPVNATITLNGKTPFHVSGKDAPGGKLTVNHQTLYELINQDSAQTGLLEITPDAPGLEAYAFTFGN